MLWELSKRRRISEVNSYGFHQLYPHRRFRISGKLSNTRRTQMHLHWSPLLQ
jgi:hypothetical protein